MIYILLPAYNEKVSLVTLLPKLEAMMDQCEDDYQIVVCDDGSQDGTEKVLNEFSRKLPMKVIKHLINRGLGETSRDLFEYAARECSDEDVIMTTGSSIICTLFRMVFRTSRPLISGSSFAMIIMSI